MDVLGIVLLIVGAVLIIVGIVTAYFTFKYFGYDRGQKGSGTNKDGTPWTNTTAVTSDKMTALETSNKRTFYVLLGVTIALFIVGLFLTIFGAYRAFRKVPVQRPAA